MKFEEFLEKEEVVVEYESASFPKEYFKLAGSDYFENPQRVIRTKDLGEWAFNELVGSGSAFDYDWIAYQKAGYNAYEAEVIYFNIAVACLGEKEVKKRLKECELK